MHACMRPMDRRMESNGSSDGAGRHRALFRAKRKRASSRSRVTCTPFNNQRGTEWTSASSLFFPLPFSFFSARNVVVFYRHHIPSPFGPMQCRPVFTYLRLGPHALTRTTYAITHLSSSQSNFTRPRGGSGVRESAAAQATGAGMVCAPTWACIATSPSRFEGTG